MSSTVHSREDTSSKLDYLLTKFRSDLIAVTISFKGA